MEHALPSAARLSRRQGRTDGRDRADRSACRHSAVRRGASAARVAGGAALIAPWLLPTDAWAASAGGDTGSLATVVLLLLLVGTAYVATHFLVDMLERRFLFTSGVEYVVLGALLGPAVPGIHAFEDLTPLAPLVALAAGWVGLLYGMELDLRRLLGTKDGASRLALIESIGTGAVVAFVAHQFFASGVLEGVTSRDALLASGVLGTAAAAGSSSAVDLLARHYKVEGGLIHTLRSAARMSDLVAIGVFGLLFCLFHEGQTQTPRPVTEAEWVMITVLLGVLLGLLFAFFLGEDESPNSRFLALVGIIAFASGAAFFLNLSSLLVNLLLGVVLVNTTRHGPGVRETLVGTSRPMSLVLLVFAGALWTPPESWLPAAAAAAGYILVRFGAKIVACWLASLGTPLRRDLSRGLLAQGDVAVAMAISFQLVYDGAAVDAAYSAILASVVLHEFVAPRVLKGLLIDAGQVAREVESGV